MPRGRVSSPWPIWDFTCTTEGCTATVPVPLDEQFKDGLREAGWSVVKDWPTYPDMEHWYCPTCTKKREVNDAERD